jgi:hypothetical protein
MQTVRPESFGKLRMISYFHGDPSTIAQDEVVRSAHGE